MWSRPRCQRSASDVDATATLRPEALEATQAALKRQEQAELRRESEEELSMKMATRRAERGPAARSSWSRERHGGGLSSVVWGPSPERGEHTHDFGGQ